MKVSESERELIVEYLPGPETPSSARHAAKRLVAGDPSAGPGLDVVMLLVSELVTNAVIHPEVPAGSKVGLSITISDDLTRAVVTDAGGGFEWPAASLPAGRVGGGFGLTLLDRTADRWGTLKAPNHFSVWFELDHGAAVGDASAADQSAGSGLPS